MRMRCLRILPEAYAVTSCPLPSVTLKIVFGSTSLTTPSSSTISSFAMCMPQATQGVCPARKIEREHFESRPAGRTSIDDREDQHAHHSNGARTTDSGSTAEYAACSVYWQGV